jgi:DNA polymerase-3 subunit epsilon
VTPERLPRILLKAKRTKDEDGRLAAVSSVLDALLLDLMEHDAVSATPTPRRGTAAESTLAGSDVLVVDCQATAASPRGQLIEVGWARAGPGATSVRTRLIRLPDHVRVPPAVARVTGLSTSALHRGVEACVAWRDLAAEAALLPQQPAPAVAHFARFERPYLAALAGEAFPFDLCCTHEIARRLLPDLPRRSLRALAGYFGRGIGPLRRSGEHVEATVFVWHQLVRQLAVEGVTSWAQLRRWLEAPVVRSTRRARVWPMPPAMRLSLPDAPGIYRMLRTSGDVLYVGKATSLRDRVNSYFRQQQGPGDRLLEMLAQARRLSFEVTASALEAALLEADEIKRHRPPYNVALTEQAREVWFAAADFSERAPRASARHPVGPFPSALTLDLFAALVHGHRAAVGDSRWGPAEDVFRAGLGLLRQAHPELSDAGATPPRQWLRLGTRLWREGHRDRDEEPDDGFALRQPGTSWTPDRVKHVLERVALRGALAVRRARWLTRFVDASVVWIEPGREGARLIVLEAGDCVLRGKGRMEVPPPLPPGHLRSTADRHAAFTVARLDRVRVLLTEVKRLVAIGAPVSVRLGPGRPFAGARLARAIAWL